MHTIHNITFEVDVNHEEQEETSWEQYYVDFLQDQLLLKIERLCNNWDAKYPNTKCSIDTITVEVAVDSLDEKELQQKIITKINDQLSNIDSNGKTSYGSVRATVTSLASPFDALLFYLKEGVLPASISVKVFKEWLSTIIQFTPTEKEALTTLLATTTESIERMLSILRNDYKKFVGIVGIKQKITKQYVKLEKTFFQKFLKVICEKIEISYQEEQAKIWFKTLGLSSSLTQFSKTFIQLLQPKAIQEKKRLIHINEYQFSMVVLQAIVQNNVQKNINISVSKAFDIVSITKDEITTIISKNNKTENTTNPTVTKNNIAEKNSADTAVIANKKHQSDASNNIVNKEKFNKATNDRKSFEDDMTQKEVLDNKTNEATKQKNFFDTNCKEEASQENTKDSFSSKTTNQSKPQSGNNANHHKQNHIDQIIFEKLARNNSKVQEIPLTTEKAGLILLNPFLVQFFTGAKLINEENKITDQGKACMLLHFIATGKEEVTDIELTLEKICLGIPLDTIINYQTPLTDDDKALCEELLQAVIQNWSVLKNSTPNMLRHMFIKREGNITLKTNSIKLIVERYAQDILLDKIPWNISLFKLKWMDKMMHIEW